MTRPAESIEVRGAAEHNLKNVDVSIERGSLTVITGVSGSGKSSLAFDTILAEAQRRFFYTLSHYSRQFLDLASRPAVRSLAGLSPAIALAQNETPPSRRATVGTLTDQAELIAVLLARFGEQRCPTHDLPTAALSLAEMASHLMATFDGQQVALCAQVAEAKKGSFKTQLQAFSDRGYQRAMIDGEMRTLTPPPTLEREAKHTIKLVVDYVKVKPGAEARLMRGIETALKEGQGFGEYFVADAKGALDLSKGGALSAKGGCPRCGFSWPRLDSRYFSANSLGQCERCAGLGQELPKDEGEDGDEGGERQATGSVCPDCHGTGLAPKLSAIRLLGLTPQDIHCLPLSELADFLAKLMASPLGNNAALRRIAEEAGASVRRVVDIGLGYLTMSRRIRQLSGGEAQRLKLAGILAENLRGVLYILDEPSQGLHPREIKVLLDALARLKQAGNTVIVVDHDEELMRAADWIIDLGPGGGARGGRIMAKFRPEEAQRFIEQSVTARHLASSVLTSVHSPRKVAATQDAIVIEGATLHNLRIDSVRFPIGALTVVTGVSGAGKSSLVLQTLYPNAVDKGTRYCKRITGIKHFTTVELVDRRKLAKSSVSMPASYLDVLGELRDLYAAQSDAQVMGLTARSFSLSVEGGRCPECKGRGEQSLSMRFLADARVRCPVCNGRRFQANVLAVRYLGLSLAEVLDLTLDEVVEHFKNHRKIVQRLEPAIELGLGYLRLGQPSISLSGGESQRLKLVPHLTKRHGSESLIILDEPTAGLHFEDVGRLLTVLRRLVEAGTTVVTIEHNADVINAADWVVELGPGAAAAGGRLVRQGNPLK